MAYNRRTPKTHVNSNGYRVYNNTGILVHRHMAEIKLGRPLNPCEVVHHIDRNKQNNNPNNLYIFKNQQAHWNAHKQDAKKYGTEYSFMGKKKKNCLGENGRSMSECLKPGILEK